MNESLEKSSVEQEPQVDLKYKILDFFGQLLASGESSTLSIEIDDDLKNKGKEYVAEIILKTSINDFMYDGEVSGIEKFLESVRNYIQLKRELETIKANLDIARVSEQGLLDIWRRTGQKQDELFDAKNRYGNLVDRKAEIERELRGEELYLREKIL